MSAFDQMRSFAERISGADRPDTVTPRSRKAHAWLFQDDGETPNNSRYSLIHYRTPLSLAGHTDPAAVFEVLFGRNGWAPDWRDGIYDYNHFHTGTHEVLGIAKGRARVRVGGAKGRIIELRAGDVVIHPAGVGHQRISGSSDLLVVGAYPEGGRYDEPQPFEVDHLKALEAIAKVPVPATDPVYGTRGPLIRLWAKSS